MRGATTTAVLEREESDGYHIMQRRADRQGGRRAQTEALLAKASPPAGGAWQRATRSYISSSCCLPRSPTPSSTTAVELVLVYHCRREILDCRRKHSRTETLVTIGAFAPNVRTLSFFIASDSGLQLVPLACPNFWRHRRQKTHCPFRFRQAFTRQKLGVFK